MEVHLETKILISSNLNDNLAITHDIQVSPRVQLLLQNIKFLINVLQFIDLYQMILSIFTKQL